ncbi:MAG: undecaprenyl-diphosphatase [Candidatus Parcubacteria bacterium]|jgi:undecaprenyl-diphosphatase|nr:undecaprenyl-diphosphatase [Candidatus Parcubacteria bacterium]
MLSSLLFIALCVVLHFAPHALALIDARASLAVAPLQTLSGIQFFLVATAFGSALGVIAIGIGFAYIGRLDTANTLRLIFLLSAVIAANKFLKELFIRARPDALAWFDSLASFSFPSAHASAAVALYGFIAAVLYARTGRLAYVFLPVVAILLVGASRVALNAHYFSDVIGGCLLGGALLAFAFLFPFERLVNRYE